MIWFISFYNSKSSLGTQYQVAGKKCWKHEGVPLLDLLCFEQQFFKQVVLHSSKLTARQIIFTKVYSFRNEVILALICSKQKEPCFGWQFFQWWLSRLGLIHMLIIICGPAVRFLNRLNSVEPNLVGSLFIYIYILSVELMKIKKIVQ